MAWTDSYATVDDFNARMGITGTAEDARIASLLAAASRQIDGWTGRVFNTSDSATAKVFSPRQWDVLAIPDAVSVTAVENDISLNRDYVDAWLATDYDLYPFDAAENGQPYTEIRLTPRGRRVFIAGSAKSVRVTAVWGWPAVPSAVQEATLLQAARLYARKQSPVGVAGTAEFALLAIPRVDPDVQSLIAQFRTFAS